MRFKIRNTEFVGCRGYIIGMLKSHLSHCTLHWDTPHGYWSLEGEWDEFFNENVTPREARDRLTAKILAKVPVE